MLQKLLAKISDVYHNIEKEKELKNVFDVIDNATDIVLVLVVAEGCEKNYVGQLEEEIKKKLTTYPSITLKILCYSDSEIQFPRMLTQVLYYFAPKGKIPLFSRIGLIAITRLERDINAARQMINGQSYEEIFYPNMVDQFRSVDKMVREENISQFSKEFQRSRTNAKISWENSKTLKESNDLLVPADVAFDRYEICKACPSLINQTCIECGCPMDAKTQLASAECPVGKWKRYKE